jgi:hypothetical protein
MITGAFCVVINAVAYLAPTLYLLYRYTSRQISAEPSFVFMLLKNSFPILLIVFALSFMAFLQKAVKENHVLTQPSARKLKH